MPGRHINERQRKIYMKARLTSTIEVAAAKAGFSTSTAYRLAKRNRNPSPTLPQEQAGPDSLSAAEQEVSDSSLTAEQELAVPDPSATVSQEQEVSDSSLTAEQELAIPDPSATVLQEQEVSDSWMTAEQEVFDSSLTAKQEREFGDSSPTTAEEQAISDSSPSAPEEKQSRHRGGRRSPLTADIEREIENIVSRCNGIRPVAILDELLRQHEDLSPGIRRTIERRVRKLSVTHGKDQDVIFRQEHHIGQRGLSDFTHVPDITIAGQKFHHMLYHFRMDCSGFEYASVVLGGESYVALAEGLQNALWELGGVPQEHRTDSLSAAFRNLTADAKEDLTRRYNALCEHYDMKPTRNNKGVARENGSIESPHGHLKREIVDALKLRCSYDFEDLAAYRAFIAEMVRRHNRRHEKLIVEERAVLRPLPTKRTTDYEIECVTVSDTCGFVFEKVFYSVPSRLIGHQLRLHVYDDRLEVFAAETKIQTLQRERAKGKRGYVIDYRHVIHSLRRKPMALYNSVYRNQLFPRDAYRLTFEQLKEKLSPKDACRTMVSLLGLAHDRACEAELAEELTADLDAGRLPDLNRLHSRFAPDPASVPNVVVDAVSLEVYDCLLGNFSVQSLDSTDSAGDSI